jgi:hypothetical protein
MIARIILLSPRLSPRDRRHYSLWRQKQEGYHHVFLLAHPLCHCHSLWGGRAHLLMALKLLQTHLLGKLDRQVTARVPLNFQLLIPARTLGHFCRHQQAQGNRLALRHCMMRVEHPVMVGLIPPRQMRRQRMGNREMPIRQGEALHVGMTRRRRRRKKLPYQKRKRTRI